ncbi:replication initiation protein [Clostridium minihomine]|uniref:replication initiation protein n=1 Tax=Clostridium minihomine TaxID=2045012 RepID=UPI000C76FB7B|nr:replication initiation protein [Clostridium minihomine]
MGQIKENHLVKNVLNEISLSSMTLQELRFFSIYLSKINPNDISTRIVRFSLSDFQAIMELDRINIGDIQTVTDSLLSKIIDLPNENGGYIGFQLFRSCSVDKNEKEEWYVEIDAHDNALPLLFEIKDALRLKSSNKMQIHEILNNMK